VDDVCDLRVYCLRLAGHTSGDVTRDKKAEIWTREGAHWLGPVEAGEWRARGAVSQPSYAQYVGDQDRILHAWLAGTARHLATNARVREAESVRQLRELAEGRTDLLAEVAGIALGVSEGRLDEYIGRRIADLCIAAGADQDQLADWVAEGRNRAAHASAGVPKTYTRGQRT
jgi:hypothetical protein